MSRAPFSYFTDEASMVTRGRAGIFGKKKDLIIFDFVCWLGRIDA